MNNPVRIALIGEAGSGKDFIAGIMVEHFRFQRYAFATPVNRLAAEFFNERYGDGSVKDRDLLIKIGMYMREIDPDVWVKYLRNRIVEDGLDRVVVTDTRMPNECAALKAMGFTFIRIQTSEETRERRRNERGDAVQPDALKHKTESYYDTFPVDFTINNDFDEMILAYASIANVLEDHFDIFS